MFNYFKLRKNQVFKFQSKIEIYQDRGPFILKTISDAEELIEALKLRYEVFHHEMIGKVKKTGIDVDEYDFVCDHLAIIDKKSNKLVGTYRLNCSSYGSNFYSANEFILRRVIEQPGIKTELGRACIHKDYRKGLVISLLWRGIAEYMLKTNSEWLFGCASIKTESPRQTALIYQYFYRDGRMPENLNCPPTLNFHMPNLEVWLKYYDRPLTEPEMLEAEELTPSLAKAYLKMGASLAGEPAYDAEFKCIDFLTILRRENLNKAIWNKYTTPRLDPLPVERSIVNE
jgi:putative hemolysin